MSQYILDFTVVLVFVLLARFIWKIARKKQSRQVKLLLKAISIFTIVHFIVFPIIYVILINQKENNIKIEKNILSFERNEKLENAFALRTKIEQRLIKNQRTELTNFAQKYSNNLSKIYWENIDNRKIIKFDSFIIQGKTKKVQIPGGDFYKVIEIYDFNGFKQFEFNTKSNRKSLKGILNDYLEEIESDRNHINEEIERIEKNQFWNYRQILPYTLNILFTDNFNPQSRIANLIYFVHNILVVGFLITLITNLFQFYLLDNK